MGRIVGIILAAQGPNYTVSGDAASAITASRGKSSEQRGPSNAGMSRGDDMRAAASMRA